MSEISLEFEEGVDCLNPPQPCQFLAFGRDTKGHYD